MSLECGRFTAEQIDAPEAISGLANESETGRTALSGVRSVMLCQYTPDHVFTDLEY